MARTEPSASSSWAPVTAARSTGVGAPQGPAWSPATRAAWSRAGCSWACAAGARVSSTAVPTAQPPKPDAMARATAAAASRPRGRGRRCGYRRRCGAGRGGTAGSRRGSRSLRVVRRPEADRAGHLRRGSAVRHVPGSRDSGPGVRWPGPDPFGGLLGGHPVDPRHHQGAGLVPWQRHRRPDPGRGLVGERPLFGGAGHDVEKRVQIFGRDRPGSARTHASMARSCAIVVSQVSTDPRQGS